MNSIITSEEMIQGGEYSYLEVLYRRQVERYSEDAARPTLGRHSAVLQGPRALSTQQRN